MNELSAVHFTLDGEAIAGQLVAASAALGGYDRATVDVAAKDARSAAQGQILGAFLRDRTTLWEGRLALPARADQGVARLEASGYKAAAEKAHGRLAYQVRDLGAWVDASGPPHNYPAGNASAQVSNVVQVQADNPTAGSVSYTAKIALWLPGITGITRYAFDASGISSVLAKLATGPSGTLTTEATHSAPGVVDRTVSVATGKDLIVLEITLTLGTNTNGFGQVANLRVNGSGVTDTLFTSAMVADIASRLGWDTSGVKATSTNALPRDVISGSWADEVLDYAAGLDDWQWRVLDDRGAGPYLEYTGWERTFTTELRYGVVEDLIPQELFNRVMVTWADDGGAPHQTTQDASPDPLAGSGITNTFEIALPEPQASDALAQQVASTLLPLISSIRWAGSLRVVAARLNDVPVDPRLILPGDVVRISDWDQGEDVLLRVHDAEWDEAGATLGIEQPASAAALVGRAGLLTPFLRAASGFRAAAAAAGGGGGWKSQLDIKGIKGGRRR